MLRLSILTEGSQYKHHIHAYFVFLKNSDRVLRKIFVEHNNKGNNNN